jgi:hypothetical protein
MTQTSWLGAIRSVYEIWYNFNQKIDSEYEIWILIHTLSQRHVQEVGLGWGHFFVLRIKNYLFRFANIETQQVDIEPIVDL